ncbi:hypothetical protein FB45DRAFT_242618 [Roridomyces roridus]|uniref:Myb/SANT-like domain-containing protein n=1 Tax=Roridomyces roridus TaxID=1738132 RepID=A0AAD7F8E4_9AGAR|nr:hypothetical protein FB45DRAFT_1067346 [Roridomyces roridus]KAJ7615320.1 hypothetical protein FB45DRAFT_242618 [Roridomyces roridus]
MPHADDPDEDIPEVDASTTSSSNWTKEETEYALTVLEKDPAKYLSGNGFKSKATTEIAAALKRKFPTRPVRKSDAVGARLRYIKGIYENYDFVRGRSGVGWDDGAKKATAEPEFIERFLEEFDRKKYERCFKKSCPFYSRLAALFGGNKATGEHVLHLNKPASSSASASSSSSLSPSERLDQPLEDLSNTQLNDNRTSTSPPASPKPYDDEIPPPPKRRRVESEESSEEKQPKKRSAREGSVSSASSTGGRRAGRTSEAAQHIGRGLQTIGESMSAPIITKSDTSHVDAIIDILLDDPTLLPNDPDGSYYALVTDYFSTNQMQARVFIKTKVRVQRIALLKRVLNASEIDIPVDWA